MECSANSKIGHRVHLVVHQTETSRYSPYFHLLNELLIIEYSDDDEANDDSASDPKPVLRVSRKVQSARSKNRENVNPNCEDTKPRKSTRHQESNAFVSLPPKKNKSHKPPDVKEVIQYERDMAIPDIVHNGVTLGMNTLMLAYLTTTSRKLSMYLI